MVTCIKKVDFRLENLLEHIAHVTIMAVNGRLVTVKSDG